MDFTKNNLKLLVCSAIVVIIFTAIFTGLYCWFRPSHKVDVKTNVELYVKNAKGKFVKTDSTQYVVKAPLEVKEQPLVDGTDYSSYLISFISVLATFVVIANFANAAELSGAKEAAIKAKEAAEKARTDAEKAKTDAEKAKTDAEKAKTDFDKARESVDEMLSKIQITKDKIDSQNTSIDSSIEDQKTLINEQSEKIREFEPYIDLVKKYTEKYNVSNDNKNDLSKILSEITQEEIEPAIPSTEPTTIDGSTFQTGTTDHSDINEVN